MKGVCLQAADGGQRAPRERFFAKGEEQRVRWDTLLIALWTLDKLTLTLFKIFSLDYSYEVDGQTKRTLTLLFLEILMHFLKCVMARLHHELCFLWVTL
jgi:hypothetical protein